MVKIKKPKITAQQIRDKCKKDIEALQKICDHPSSRWCEDWTMCIGHSLGQVRLCGVCEKMLEDRRYKILDSEG